MTQHQRLTNVFNELSKTGRTVRYGDILRAGISSHVVDSLIEGYNAKLINDSEGYTIITLN
jgi:hypothetical protein